MKLCSACLLGIDCAYNGKSKANSRVIELSKKEVLIPVCPEQLGGLSTPRKAAGIYGGLGKDVIEGKATVRAARDGEDLTKRFVRGAEQVLKIARLLEIKEAILKQNSPSCGCGKTWQLDKELFNHSVKGYGVITALLKKNEIKVISEEDL